MAVRGTNNREAGFSLIELMVSLAIFGIVLAGIVVMFTSSGRYHTGQEMMVEVTQNGRAVRNLMVDEIRSAGCNPKETGRMGFLTTNDSDHRFDTDADAIHFTRDIDNDDGDAFYESDGDARDSNEDIAYYRTQDEATCLNSVAISPLPGGTLGVLCRNTTGGDATPGGGQPVMERVTDLQFQYYDSAGTLVTSLASNSDLDQIKSVEVTITGQVENPNLVSAGNREWTQQFQILVRNSFGY